MIVGIGLGTLFLNRYGNKLIVMDSFNRSDATNLTTSESGQNWINRAGSVGIKDNKAYSPLGSQNNIAVIDSKTINCSISQEIYLNDSNSVWIEFRSLSQTSRFYLELTRDGRLFLRRNSNGTITTIASTTVTFINGNSLAVTLLDNNIKIYYNNALLLNISDSFNNSVTYHGFGFWNSSINYIDNFKIEAIS